MGKKKKVRDSTGPYKDSFQRKKSKIGKRKQRGEVCIKSKTKGRKKKK